MSQDVVFISHGGGPRPLLGDPQHAGLVSFLRALPQSLQKPKQIVVFSAHWEGPSVGITSAAEPSLLYDYYGFPPESYEFRYPCPGAPELAAQIASGLTTRGYEVSLDDQRGLDHGVFVPLMLMYPSADIPVIQVSLSSSLNPEWHIQLGEDLGAMGLSETLFIGSGFSFHNMRAFFIDGVESQAANQAFEEWLAQILSGSSQSPGDIREKLIHWRDAPGAAFCHPREEHLLPLHVCFGIAGRPADQRHVVEMLNKQASNFIWNRSGD